VDQVRGWLDAISPRLGLRDEVADVIVLAWAALRQRAWYHHGPIPAPRPGAVRPDMELRPEPLPEPGDWRAAISRVESLFGIHVNPYLTAAGVAELTENVRVHADSVADAAVKLVAQVELAYRHLGLPGNRPGRLATARTGASLLETLRQPSSRVHLVETLARASLPTTETAVANSLSQAGVVAAAITAFRWDRLGPLRAAEGQPDERGRSAGRMLAELRDAVTADEFTTRLGPALSATDDAIFQWLALGQPAAPAPLPSQVRPDDVPLQLPPRSAVAGGAVTRDKGAPASVVLGPLQEFLDAHRDEQVIVEWRVQE
jgi:hypothetical protein